MDSIANKSTNHSFKETSPSNLDRRTAGESPSSSTSVSSLSSLEWPGGSPSYGRYCSKTSISSESVSSSRFSELEDDSYSSLPDILRFVGLRSVYAENKAQV